MKVRFLLFFLLIFSTNQLLSLPFQVLQSLLPDNKPLKSLLDINLPTLPPLDPKIQKLISFPSIQSKLAIPNPPPFPIISPTVPPSMKNTPQSPSILTPHYNTPQLNLSNANIITTSPNIRAENTIQRATIETDKANNENVKYHIIYSDPLTNTLNQSSSPAMKQNEIQELILLLYQQLYQQNSMLSDKDKRFKPVTIIKQYVNPNFNKKSN